MLATLRHALAALGIVAALATAVPPASSAGTGASEPASGVGVDTAAVNRIAVQPTPPRKQDISAPHQLRNDLGPPTQPASIALDRVEQPVGTPRPLFTTRATSLVAAKATIAAQPRAPPHSRISGRLTA